ncbi:MAG: tetratricopeptide repeat protein [Candidatus Latescibacterota bacterium]
MGGRRGAGALVGWLARTPRRRALVILAGVALVYAGSLGGSFQYDDRHSIVENPHIRDLRRLPDFLLRPQTFSRDPDKAMFRPLVVASLALNHAWSGYAPWSYHLVNGAAHALCSLLLCGLLRQLGACGAAALFGGLAFAVHPLATEPVNYISSRSETFATAGVMGGLWLYQRAPGPFSWWRAASLAAFALGLLSKSTALLLPALLLAGDWAAGRRARGRWRLYLPYGAVAAGYLLVVRPLLVRATLDQPVRGWALQLGTQAKALAYYARLLLMPVRQSVDHAFAQSSLAGVVPLAALALAASAAWLAWRGRRWSPLPLLALLLAGVGLAPTVLVPLNVLVNEHRLYLPLAGLALLAGGLRLCGSGARLQGALAAVAVLVLALLAAERSRLWRDEGTLWADAAARGPGLARPRVYLGNHARAQGRPAEAVAHYEAALRLEPAEPAARANLASALAEAGRLAEALAAGRDLLAVDPESGDLHYLLAGIHRQAGAADSARWHYLAVPPDSPHQAAALNMLGVLQEEGGCPDSAMVWYARAAAASGETAGAEGNVARLQRVLTARADTLVRVGQHARAEVLCRRLLDGDPDLHQARFLLAVSLFGQRRYSESIRQNEELMRRHPDFDEGWLQLANALEASGRLPEAEAAYRSLATLTRDPQMHGVALQRLEALRGRAE